MKKKEQLFQLIKSLSKAEKGYFKKFSSRHVIGGKNNYIKLFDVIEKLKDYDEKKIREELKSESFIKHLPEAKYYLQKLIIKSLTAFHSESLVDYRIKEMIHSIEILREKNLFEYCITLLDKAKTLALKYERFILLMELLFLERVLLSDVKDFEQTEKFFNTFPDRIKKYTELMLNSARMHALREKISRLEVKYGPTRESEKLNENEKLYRDEISELAASPLSFESKRNLMSVYNMYYKYKGDFINSYINSKKAVQLMDDNMELTKQIMPRYVASIHNYLIACLQVCRFDEFDEGILKLKDIPKKYPSTVTDELKLYMYNAFHIELDKYIRLGKFTEGLKLIPEAVSGLDEYEGRSSRVFEIMMMFNIAYLYFGAGEYKQSLKWTNRLINATFAGVRIDTQVWARMINIIIHFELGNYDMIEYLLKSTYRFVEQKKRLYHTESLLLKFFGDTSRQLAPEMLKEKLSTLRSVLQNASEDPLEKTVFEEFDFLSWAESKLENRSFESIVQEKSLAKQKMMERLLEENVLQSV